MNITDEVVIDRIARLDLKPGDKVLIEVHLPMTAEAAARFQAAWAKKFPGVEAVVLDAAHVVGVQRA